MPKDVLTVSEARAELPRLIKQVVAGKGPVYVGARGKPQAALVDAEELDALLAARAGSVGEAAAGWKDGALALEIVGTDEDLQRTLDEIGREALRSVDESWDRVEAGTTRARRKGQRRP